MQDDSLVLILLGVAILAAVFVIVTPDEATINPEQEALIARHELAPGLTRDTAIDIIGTNAIHWEGSGWVVDLENCMGPRGSASLDSRMTPEMVIASWGEPDSTRRTLLGFFYTYHQPPDGDVQAQFNCENVAIDVDTVLAPEYFRRRFPEWTDTECVLVSTEQVALGMAPQIARASWGIPSDIIHSVGSWGVREQWVYRRLASSSPRNLYFENGILTSWQD